MLCTETRLLEQAAEAPQLALFLDYDGTLDDFAPTPDVILPNPEVIALLRRLRELPGTHVIVISGRRLAHIEGLLPVPGLLLAGTYGLELRLPGGERPSRLSLKEVRPVLGELKPRWAALIVNEEGFYLEDKRWTLALHARFADDARAEGLLAEAHRVAAKLADPRRFQIVGGHKFLEVGPLLAHKGRTVAYLLEHQLPSEVFSLYLGDDDKDEQAFPVIHAHGGQAAVVTAEPRTTEADCRLPDPEAVRAWLERLYRERRALYV